MPKSTIDTWDGSSDITWFDNSKDEFVITTAEQLAGMAQLSTSQTHGYESFNKKTIKLMNDLDLAGYEWKSIGEGGSNSLTRSFAGTFDGQNHVIYNLSTEIVGAGHGLFGTVYKGTIKNLGVEDADVYMSVNDTTFNAGILADWADMSVIQNCYTTGKIVSERSKEGVGLGGIVGQCTGDTEIVGCYSTASVQCLIPDQSADVVGGIVGQWETSRDSGARRAKIQDCWFGGEIMCTSEISAVGGILGADFTFRTYGILIENCFVNPTAVSLENNPANFCYIGAADENGNFKNCYYSEPETVSGDEGEYFTAVRLVVDWTAGTASPDPNFVADVENVEDMLAPEFLEKLNKNASHSPQVTWVRGGKNPTFDWDVRNRVPDIRMTATASNADEAKIEIETDLDGTVWYSIYEAGTENPVTGEDLKTLVDGQQGDAYGTFGIGKNTPASFTAQGLKPVTEYTVSMAVKSAGGVWSDLASVNITTMKELLRGTATLSGFPVAGEELSVTVENSQGDAQLNYAWYRGKDVIAGENSDTYTLQNEDIKKKIRVEVTADNYRGKLVSDPTPEIAKEYTVTKIEITKKPDRVVYGIGESFEKAGMEVRAYLKASSSNADSSTAVKILADHEYDVSPSVFSAGGDVKVTVTYMGAEAFLNVTVVPDNLEGTVGLTGDPVVGEKLTAETDGVQKDASLRYIWYRNTEKIKGASGSSYTLLTADAGQMIRVEVTASNYAGKLVSDQTEKIQKNYVVSEIKVTKLPDKTVYKAKETFDGAGMTVTARLKIRQSDQNVAKERTLSPQEYTVSCSLDSAGTSLVTVMYQENGMIFQDTFEVTVEADQQNGNNGSEDEDSGDDDSEYDDSEYERVKHERETVRTPIAGNWVQLEDGSWTFVREDGIPAENTWLYIANGDHGDWYRFDESGVMLHGWYLDTDGRWYYLNPVSAAATWGQDADGAWYWTGRGHMPYGAMYAGGVTPDGWIVGADGAMIGKYEEKQAENF